MKNKCQEIKKTNNDLQILFILNKYVAPGGAGLSDEQREEMANREGVAAGGAT